MNNDRREKIKKIIDDWDPLNLFPDAPDNEYWTEIDDITDGFPGVNSKEELAKVIQMVFINSFNEEMFGDSFEECLEIAEKISIEINEKK